MPCFIRPVLICLLAVLLPGSQALAQGAAPCCRVDSIRISGNAKTREPIVRRELDFAVGDSIGPADLEGRLALNRTLLLNTGLFYQVDIAANAGAGGWVVDIVLREAWYIFPVPVFELADRNFNVWWVQFGASLQRVNYGANLYWQNFTGRRDMLKLKAQRGFVEKYELEYTLPYLNRQQTLGAYVNVLYARQRELPYTTTGSDLLFYRSEAQQLLWRRRLNLGLSYRPAIRAIHRLVGEWHDNRIADTVLLLNPDFFAGQARQRYAALAYSYELDYRDLRAYPTQGYLLQGELRKNGLLPAHDVQQLSLMLGAGYYERFGPGERWALSLYGEGRYAFQRQRPPYYNNQALGYETRFVRGHEYYVLDGMDYGFAKMSLRYGLWQRAIDWGRLMPLRPFRVMPLRVYLSANWDNAYVNDPHHAADDPLANVWLSGYGLGLDVVAFVDKVVQIEYSVNRLGEKGLYLHFEFSF